MENNNNNNKKSIIGSVIIVLVFVMGLFFLKGSAPPPPEQKIKENSTEDIFKDVQIRPVNTTEDHILGNPNAEIMIVEYSDTECPFCKVFHKTMHQIVLSSDGNVAWVYRQFPIEVLHTKAFYEAEATECAWSEGGNEMFWKYTDEIYARTNSNDSLEVSELSNIAKDLGLDITSFESCLANGTFKNKIENDILDGQSIGVRGTPTSFILKNGKIVDIIEGAQPFEMVIEKINKALK